MNKTKKIRSTGSSAILPIAKPVNKAHLDFLEGWTKFDRGLLIDGVDALTALSYELIQIFNDHYEGSR